LVLSGDALLVGDAGRTRAPSADAGWCHSISGGSGANAESKSCRLNASVALSEAARKALRVSLGSTFSSDIAYARSPAASRASAGSA